MKFTKESACKELVSKMTANGEALNLSERSIGEQVEKLLPLVADDETELDAFVEKVLPFIKTADANVRTDVSSGIRKYKDDNPVQKPAEPTKPIEPKGNETELEKLRKQVEALVAKDVENQRVAKTRETKKQLVAKMKELGVKNEEWAESFVAEINVGEDFDVEAKAKDYLNLYNKFMSDTPPDVTPRGTRGGNGKDSYADNVLAEAVKIAKNQRYEE